MTDRQNGAVATAVFTVILVILLAVSAVYIVKLRADNSALRKKPASSAETTSSNSATTKNEADTIKERADYTYKYISTPGDFKYDDLLTKGYITANVIKQKNDVPESGHDLLTCSQMAAKSYSFAEPKINSSAATLVTTGQYDSSTVNIQTTWINDNGTWKIDSVTCPST